MVGRHVQDISLITSLHGFVLVVIRPESVLGPVDEDAHVDGSWCPWRSLNLTASVHGSHVEECYVPDVGEHVVLR